MSQPEKQGGGGIIDIGAGVVLAAASLVALFWLIPNHTQPAMSELDISPGLFPTVAAGLVLALSIGMIVQRSVRRPVLAAELSGGKILIELAVWTIAGLAIFLALPTIGFLPVAFAIVALGGLAVRYRTWWLLGLIAVLFPVAVDFGAWQIFTVDLP